MAGARIVADAQALQVEGYADRGIGRYIAAFLAALDRRSGLVAALLAPELPPPLSMPDSLVSAGLVRWDGATTCRDIVESEPSGPVYLATAPFLHIGAGDPPALGPAAHWARLGLPRATVLYDLIPLRAPSHYLPSPGHRERFSARARWVAESDLVLAISEHTAREAVELLGCPSASVVTIGAGVSPYFSPPDGTDEELWRHHFPALEGRPYMLTVGGSDARKGTERAIAAAAQLMGRGVDVDLLVAGHLTDDWRRRLGEAARACGADGRVVFAGAVSDELLRACYRRATITLMPSLAEGFGLPVLESAACGTPALASATTALAETAAVDEALFDPTDVDSIADRAERVLGSPSLAGGILTAQRSICRRSTWDAVAARTLDAIGGRWPDGAGTLRPVGFRLAVVAARGHAARSDSLAASLRHLPRVEAVDRYSTLPEPGDHRALPADLLGVEVRAASYDHVVYVGDGGDEPLANRCPGWVWLLERPGAARLEHLRRSCRGLVVADRSVRDELDLELPPFAARPPIVEIDPRNAAAELLAAMESSAGAAALA